MQVTLVFFSLLSWSRFKWILLLLIALINLKWQNFWSNFLGLFLFTACSSLLPQVVAVYGTLSDLLSVASNKLGIKATSVYNGKGGLIDDIALIR